MTALVIIGGSDWVAARSREGCYPPLMPTQEPIIGGIRRKPAYLVLLDWFRGIGLGA